MITAHILIIEKNTVLKKLTTGILRNSGYTNLDCADDFQDALKRITKYQYDSVIFSSDNFDAMNAEIINNFIEKAEELTIPILIIKPNTSNDNILKIKQSSTIHHLEEPFEKDVIVKTLQRLIA